MRKFMKGEEVEVSTDEEGFEDSWFAATVIGLSRSRNKYIIEYKTLLNRRGTNPLREYVHLSKLRPVPPKETISTTRYFQLDEEVDAYLHEGWWKGVINKIISEGSRYSVFFPPTKEVLEFDQADLRNHLDWIDGKWVYQNQVLFEETAVIPENYGSFLSPILTGNSVCSIDMDVSQTPCAVRRNLWMGGVTNSKNMQGSMNESVQKVSSQKNTNDCTSKSDVEIGRPLKKVRGGQTTETPTPMKACNAKESLIENPTAQYVLSSSTMQQNRRKLSRAQHQSDVIEVEHTEVIGIPEGLMEGPLCGTEMTLQGVRALDNQTKVLMRKKELPGSDTRSKISSNEVIDVQTGCTLLSSDIAEDYIAEDYQPLSMLLEKFNSHAVKDIEGVADKKVVNVLKRKRKQPKGSSKEASVTVGLENEFPSNKGTNVETEGTPLSSDIAEEHHPLSMILEKATSDVVNGIEGVVDKQVVNVLERKSKQLKGSSKEASLIGNEHQAVSRKMSVTFDDQDRYGNESGDERHLRLAAVTEKTYSSPKQQDERILPALGESWPFIKSSHMWGAFESNQVFKLMPQHPHFWPLEQYNEEFREGKAIGNMFNFVNLVERTLKAKLNEPRSLFVNRLKLLAGLEEHGFAVQPIRIRLEEILKRKTRQCELDDQKRVAEREIGEGKRKLDEINMKLQRLLKDKEMKRSTLAESERKMAGIKELLQGVELDFDKMVASPLASTNCE
ncbi:hypothetical protein FRX31_015608 [Thalictrum thalictroides]|uniref:Agenet domain-containing protein n=1 Tax=Thalictrum thalictroides TaxID=46969 RepID=A0A7J6WEJ3_THATH|nr:hypothetical protein FRX31_015608 [Thalictrum thalictroides]